MKKVIREVFEDWKTWVIFGCGFLNIMISLWDKDWTEALWCLLANVLYFTGSIQNIVIQDASDYIEKQENTIMEAGAIMHIQAEVIKELNDKLDEQTKSNENGVRDTELDQSGERSEKNMG